MTPRADLTRRRFLTLAGVAGTGLLARPLRLTAASSLDLVAEEPWAGIVRLSDGVWAVASTPMRSSDWTTGCNGGLVAGSERVLAIESFGSVDGAGWLRSQAVKLAGRPPSDVLVTHYHGDHANGLAGYAEGDDAPRLWMTAATRDLVVESDAQRDAPEDPVRAALLAGATLLDPDGSTDLDLGGRTVRLEPRSGHTASDVTVELEEPSVVFFGDLLWNGFFPNYRDTLPTAFAASIRAARRPGQTIYVPGHGAIADERAVDLCLTLVDAVEQAARSAFEDGVAAADAAEQFRLPDAVADWILFNERYFEVAIGAWHKELDGND